MKLKKLKRIISGFCATIIVMSSFVTYVGAEGNSEVAFSLKYWDYFNKLTKTKDLSQFTEYELDKLDSERKDLIKHVGGEPSEEVKIDERHTHSELLKVVGSLISKVDDAVPEQKSNLNVFGYKPKKWYIAKAIYNWVIDNIQYDYESIKEDENGQKIFRKPQDALFVYSQRKGVCLGKANLINLMMRMAKIPCVVIETPTHAYNAIYLEGNDSNHSGWTLIDATWGAPESDLGYVERDDQLMGGVDFDCENWLQNAFSIVGAVEDENNEYIESVAKLINMPENMEKNDESINKFNAEIADGLSILNQKTSNNFKITDIKFGIFEKDDVKRLYVQYKTNLDYNAAKKIREKYQALTEDYEIENLGEFSWTDDVEGFDTALCNWYLDINTHLGKSVDRSKEYFEKLNGILARRRQYTTDENRKNIKELENNIKTEINALNTSFGDLITIESVEFQVIYDEDIKADVLQTKLKSNLTFDDTKKVMDKYKWPYDPIDDHNVEQNKEYFPAFYEDKLSFEFMNKDMIQKENHDVMCITDGRIHAYQSKDGSSDHEWPLIINGVSYKRYIDQNRKSYIKVDVEDKNCNNVVELDSDIVNLGMPLKIGFSVKSLNLVGDQTVDLSEATHLQSVNTDRSNRYISKEAILCDKDTNQVICIFKPFGKTTSGIDYSIMLKNSNNCIDNVDKIWFGTSYEKEFADVKIPEFLKQLNKKVPILIGSDITSLILESDEFLDLSVAFELKSIDITKSTRYEKRDDKLFDKILGEEVKCSAPNINIVDNRFK